MKRVMIWASALMILAAGFAVMGENEANAGLFNRKKCKQRKSCGQPACEASAPAPCVIEATPACGCEAQTESCSSCETNCNCLSRRQLRKANRKGQCCGAEANTCNTCSAAEEAAPEAPQGDATT